MNVRTSTRMAWGSLAVYLVAGLTAEIVLWAAQGHTSSAAAAAGWDGTSFASSLALGAAFLTFPLIGAIVASRRPENRLGWVLVLIGVVLTVEQLIVAYATLGIVLYPGRLPGATATASFDNAGWVPMIVLMGVYVPLLFPDGQLPGRRWRPVAWAVGAGSTLAFLVVLITPGKLTGGSFPDAVNPLGIQPLKPVLSVLAISVLVVPIGVVAAAIAVIGRYRRSRGAERLQMKWLVTAAAIVTVLYAIAILLSLFVFRVEQKTSDYHQPIGLSIVQITAVLSFGLLPVAIGFAVLRYKLYEIEVIINKAVVYGLLAAFFTAVYVAVVVGIGTAIGSTHNPFLTPMAAAVMAIAFDPVRERAKRLANRLVYGERATPYEVLSEFSERMAGTYAIDEMLPRMARILAEGTGASRADVWLAVSGTLRSAASWPSDQPSAEPLPLDGDAIPHVPRADRVALVRHRGETLGALSLTKKPGEVVTPTEEKLLADLASQAGLVLRNAQLYEEQRSQAEAFARFVPRPFLERLGHRRIADVRLGDAVTSDLVVLFSDLRGFTHMSESLTAQESFELLNAYLERMEPAVHEHGGFIDKFLGDGVMALFIDDPDGAVAAGVAMHQALLTFNEERRDREPLRMGVGLHAGIVMLGTVGGLHRMETTVIGDTVNTASRIEAMTKHYGTPLLMSSSVRDRLGPRSHPGLRPVGRVRVKGKSEAVNVHEVLDARPASEAAPLRAIAPTFDSALALWFRAEFVPAAELFGECLRQAPFDRLSARYRALCEERTGRPVPDGWDGVDEMTEK